MSAASNPAGRVVNCRNARHKTLSHLIAGLCATYPIGAVARQSDIAPSWSAATQFTRWL